jgi:large subunit ribosomal protein L22e
MSKAVQSKKKQLKFVIKCDQPVQDEILDIGAFEKFMLERIKVNGKAGVLGESVAVAREGNALAVTAKIDLSKRYLKYLTKKFLKKQQLRDYIRVIADDKNSFLLKYFNIQKDDDDS